MERYLLQILAENNNPMLIKILNGLEEQGILFKIVSLKEERNIDLNKVPFNIAVVIKNSEAYLIGRDFKNKFIMDLQVKDVNNFNDSKRLKNFGVNVGRYIKGTPLEGE